MFIHPVQLLFNILCNPTKLTQRRIFLQKPLDKYVNEWYNVYSGLDKKDLNQKPEYQSYTMREILYDNQNDKFVIIEKEVG